MSQQNTNCVPGLQGNPNTQYPSEVALAVVPPGYVKWIILMDSDRKHHRYRDGIPYTGTVCESIIHIKFKTSSSSSTTCLIRFGLSLNLVLWDHFIIYNWE